VSHLYSVFGLLVQVNRTIPGLLQTVASRPPDVQIRLGEQFPWPGTSGDNFQIYFVSQDRNEDGNPALSVWKLDGGSHFRILFHDGAEFVIDREATRIWGAWPESLTLEDAAVYLRGPILGFALRLRGVTCLHAAAVAVDDRALALLGPPGSGKSTTAAAFARLGHAVLSDNIVALVDQRGAFMVLPSFPQILLWPDSVRTLYGSEEALPRATPGWDKRFLDLTRFHQHPLPLGAVYLLGERLSNSAELEAEAVPRQEAFTGLIANSYMNYLLDGTMRAQEFETFGRVVGDVPVRRVRPHQDPAYLLSLCGIILHDFLDFVPTTFASRRAPPILGDPF